MSGRRGGSAIGRSARRVHYPVGMSETPPDVAFFQQPPVNRVAGSQRGRVPAAAVLGVATLLGGEATAGNWIFRPSYYSHEVAPPDRPLPSSRSSYRVPSVSNNPGVSVRGRFRINNFTLRNGRGGSDRTIYVRGGVELDP